MVVGSRAFVQAQTDELCEETPAVGDIVVPSMESVDARITTVTPLSQENHNRIPEHITQIEGVPYGAFIVPGLVMLSLLTQSITNASFGIYFPKFIGTIFELLSAPVSPNPEPYFASGSGRSWNFITLLVVPLPPSM